MLITIEGVIGVGKSTATRLLAETLGGETLYEIVEENPFLKDFYKDPGAWALQTAKFFLFSRIKQLQDAGKRLAAGATIFADYHVFKTPVMAGLTLNAAQREEFWRLFHSLTPDLPKADLVIYLKADHDTLMERIRRRERSFEQNMDPDYIRRLSDEYDRYFLEPGGHLGRATVHVVDTTHLDLVHNLVDTKLFSDRVQQLISAIRPK